MPPSKWWIDRLRRRWKLATALALTLAATVFAVSSCSVPTSELAMEDLRKLIARDIGPEVRILEFDGGVGEGDAEHAYMHKRFRLLSEFQLTVRSGPLVGLVLQPGQASEVIELVSLYQYSVRECLPRRHWCVVTVMLNGS